ncbi:hypothetical protein PBY51_006081 [Eleginops maclovinus]|uniref:Uncharacterized protein n=1 Tax=Eleginops maclovinus TaxID=56733 RepID=A0AAN7WWE3_ELEMC|nr:hypothetical protein PBY51_006081 [Eleginops maclovinus]
MAVGSIISPEHGRLTSVQSWCRHGEEPQKYQSKSKRSSKDWYPPDLALVRTRMHIRKMIKERKPQRHGDILDTWQELEDYWQHLEKS